MRFTVQNGSHAGTSFTVDGAEFVIGRGAECDLVVDQGNASRKHARIYRLPDGRLALQDLGSTNGTFVNGTQVQSVILEGPTRIQIGETIIDAAPAEAPVAAGMAAQPPAPGQAAGPGQPPPGPPGQPAFGTPTPQQIGARPERPSRVSRITTSVVQQLTPSTIQRIIKRRSRKGMIAIGSVSAVIIAGLVGLAFWLSRGDQVLPAKDKGDFQLQILPGEGDQANYQKVLTESGVVQEVTNRLNREIALPRNVPIILRPSENDDDISPYWDPRKKRIEVPYLWVALVATLFQQKDPNLSREDLVGRVTDTTYFVMYHEVGHGLIDILKLPVTGREEDAVDGLAAALLIPSGDTAVQQVLRSAELFQLLGEKKTKDAEAFADEHSLGEQRFYQLACWVFGSDPAKYGNIVEQGYLPEERAVRCKDEYKQNVTSWEKLLDRYQPPKAKPMPQGEQPAAG